MSALASEDFDKQVDVCKLASRDPAGACGRAWAGFATADPPSARVVAEYVQLERAGRGQSGTGAR